MTRYGMVPLLIAADPRVRSGAVRVYTVVAACSVNGQGCWRSLADIAELATFKDRKDAKKHLTNLVATGYLTVKKAPRPRQPSNYRPVEFERLWAEGKVPLSRRALALLGFGTPSMGQQPDSCGADTLQSVGREPPRSERGETDKKESAAPEAPTLASDSISVLPSGEESGLPRPPRPPRRSPKATTSSSEGTSSVGVAATAVNLERLSASRDSLARQRSLAATRGSRTRQLNVDAQRVEDALLGLEAAKEILGGHYRGRTSRDPNWQRLSRSQPEEALRRVLRCAAEAVGGEATTEQTIDEFRTRVERAYAAAGKAKGAGGYWWSYEKIAPSILDIERHWGDLNENPSWGTPGRGSGPTSQADHLQGATKARGDQGEYGNGVYHPGRASAREQR